MSNVLQSAVTAHGLTKRGVFGPVDLDVPAGGLTVLQAPAGRARTCLLLTIAGRMRPTAGTLSVFGATKPKQVFARAAIGAVDEVDEVYDAVTVGALVTEKLRWDAPWYRLVPARTRSVAEVCGPVFGPLGVPDAGTYVEDLDEKDVFLLRVALANTRRRPLLVVGDVDRLSSDDDQATVLERLADLGRTQTVLAATSNPVGDFGQRRTISIDESEGTN